MMQLGWRSETISMLIVSRRIFSIWMRSLMLSIRNQFILTNTENPIRIPFHQPERQLQHNNGCSLLTDVSLPQLLHPQLPWSVSHHPCIHKVLLLHHNLHKLNTLHLLNICLNHHQVASFVYLFILQRHMHHRNCPPLQRQARTIYHNHHQSLHQ